MAIDIQRIIQDTVERLKAELLEVARLRDEGFAADANEQQRRLTELEEHCNRLQAEFEEYKANHPDEEPLDRPVEDDPEPPVEPPVDEPEPPVEPPEEEDPDAGQVGLGVYNGGPGEKPDEKTREEFGVTPDVANTYYQPKQTNLNIAYETARIKRGTSPNLTITTKGTQHIAGIAKGDAAALKWLDAYIASLKKLAQVDPAVPIYATLEHEYRAKVKQGLVTGESAKPEVYGKALAVFYKRAKAAHKNIKTTYWIVGYDRAFEGAVGEAFHAAGADPDVMVFDPYANAAKDTVASIMKADLAWFRSQPWYQGQPFGLGEFGMPVTHGDAAMAKFFTNVRSQLREAGISWAVFFNRTKDNNHKITTGAFPKAVAAFSRSLKG